MGMEQDKKTTRGKMHSGRLMKMKELSAATGVKGPAIRYYINQGLLPKPYKTHKNMAYYDESYISLIRVIKKFQKEYFLPLDVIKKVFDDLGHDQIPLKNDEVVKKLLQAQQMNWMEPDAVNMPVKPVSQKELVEMTGISRKDLKECLRIGLLVQNEDKTFNVPDVKIAKLITDIRRLARDDLGFSFDFIAFHIDFLNEVVDKEFKYFLTRILKGELSVQEANDLAFKCTELFYRIFPIIHKRYLNKKIKESLNIVAGSMKEP